MHYRLRDMIYNIESKEVSPFWSPISRITKEKDDQKKILIICSARMLTPLYTALQMKTAARVN